MLLRLLLLLLLRVIRVVDGEGLTDRDAPSVQLHGMLLLLRHLLQRMLLIARGSCLGCLPLCLGRRVGWRLQMQSSVAPEVRGLSHSPGVDAVHQTHWVWCWACALGCYRMIWRRPVGKLGEPAVRLLRLVAHLQRGLMIPLLLLRIVGVSAVRHAEVAALQRGGHTAAACTAGPVQSGDWCASTRARWGRKGSRHPTLWIVAAAPAVVWRRLLMLLLL
mmetsp:Transcript_7050/g.20639  ORF Transcript_7050/g.20639 Transcript_7050/m.20639 type:complete len:219 (-) Transcript_7050:1559-2215(-)